MDWGAGEYELTAAELWPVAERVVARDGAQPGERVLDLGCGTGNAALLAARAGAEVIGLDPSPRLLEVARERLAAEGLEGSFTAGTAEELAFEDCAFDRAFSIFALIFTPDPARAAGELLRVLRPGGHAVVTTWTPEGALADAIGTLGRGVAALSPQPPPARFGWGEEAVVRDLFEGRGARVDIDRGELGVEAPSAEAFVERFLTRHPMGIPWAKALEAAGTYDAVSADAVQALQKWNEDPAALRVTSGYLIVKVQRDAESS
jgi:SAM-dependent methyltransferase